MVTKIDRPVRIKQQDQSARIESCVLFVGLFHGQKELAVDQHVSDVYSLLNDLLIQ